MGSHNGTPATWTCVSITFVAFAVGGVALVVNSLPIFIVSVVLLVVGGIVGKVMQLMGFGVSHRGGVRSAFGSNQTASDAIES